jgi:hypothetical protein
MLDFIVPDYLMEKQRKDCIHPTVPRGTLICAVTKCEEMVMV